MAENKGTALVTGGSGFLGSHAANALTRAGYKVRVFDAKGSEHLLEGQEMVIGDILDTAALKKAVSGCDVIYHFAGIADIGEANDNPAKTAEFNIMGTLNALEAAREAGVKRFVFASTVYVYSNSGGFYRASKQACENFIETYHDKHGLPYTILRYGSLYGRRAGATNGIYRLIKSAIETGKIVYEGDADAMREYIHVSDAARLSVDILDEKYANRHIVLTGQERMRVVDLMRMIAEMLPNQPKLEFAEKKMAGHYVMTPYNYSPKLGHKVTLSDHIDLGQGILDCVQDMYEQLEANKAAE